MSNTEKFDSMYQVNELDTVGDRWLTNSRGSQVVRYEINRNILRKIFSDGEARKYLDIACAQSQMLTFAKSEFSNVELYGSDISNNVIEWNKNTHQAISYQTCALPNVCFEKMEFDVITAFEVVYYLNKEDQLASIQNIANKLNVGGYMVISGGLDQGERFFKEDWLISNTEKIIGIDHVKYNYAKLYRKLETPLLKTINVIRKIKEYRKFNSVERQQITNTSNSKLTSIAMKLVSNNFFYAIFYILQLVFSKFAFFVLKWEWLPKVCASVSKRIYADQGKTNIIIVCKK